MDDDEEEEEEEEDESNPTTTSTFPFQKIPKACKQTTGAKAQTHPLLLLLLLLVVGIFSWGHVRMCRV